MVEIVDKYKSDSRVVAMRKFFSSAQPRQRFTVKSLVASARAVAVAAVGADKNVVVCAERDDAPYLYHDLCCLLGDNKVFFLPSSFRHKPMSDAYDAQNVQLRTEALAHFASDKAVTIVTYAAAMSEKVPGTASVKEDFITVRKGDKISLTFLVDTLLEYGFTRSDFVYEPGQFSVRGSIVDLFSYATDAPTRVDFFGDEVDSLRSFDLESQLSTDKIDSVNVVPDLGRVDKPSSLTPFSQSIPSSAALWIVDPEACRSMLNAQYEAAATAKVDEGSDAKPLSPDLFCTADEWGQAVPCPVVDLNNATPEADLDFRIVGQPLFKKNFDLLEDDIYYKSADSYQVFLLSDNSRQLQRLRSILSERRRKLKYSEMQLSLHAGFVDKQALLCFYTDHQIFERFQRCALRNDDMRRQQQSITLRELSELKIGDYVVHIDHGVGVFGGLVTQHIGDKTYESIKLTYQDGDTLYVNVQSMHKISKYRGKDGVPPRINRLGSAHWTKLKEKAKSRVKDIARDLIELYAKRKDEEGFAFSPDSYMQQELEASFLYEDTPDQYKANKAIKADMERQSPMDRLVCGDVGFGKTELAIRAAFKAVCDNKQVAVLVPTTVLAFQHYNTFRARLDGLPCKVEYISRLRKPAEVKSVIKRLAAGDVDIVIGTHRLIGKDVKFKDLGLLIIDEEQRFGVGVKEKLRQMKVNVDTLTLSATPIPRTLQFSLMGARDLSVLATPPANRQPIETIVQAFSEDAMRDAVNYEIARGGQVFIINNRIEHLVELQRVLARILPDVKTVVAHGQMEGTALESIMLDFINGDYDVLLATTIIESGLDIPNANTIIINNAHLFGLSELHQLRGRVGRSNKKAFCYLFAPPFSTLTQEARRRLQIIEEFADLGSGFNIAMQDLDIRGAGDVLGAEQSGFITDMGYETYQKVLAEAIIELKTTEFKDLFAADGMAQNDALPQFVADTQVTVDDEALLPDDYISSISERMRLYRQLDAMDKDEDIDRFSAELVDRFGPLPPASVNLLEVVKIRNRAQRLGVERVFMKDGVASFHFVSDRNSAFYQSPVFSSIIVWIQANPRRAQLKQTTDKLYMSIKSVSTLAELRALVDGLSSFVEAQNAEAAEAAKA
ncbi:MAG: transcription-repair coupling factor [Marinilabiliaceae bacterium]